MLYKGFVIKFIYDDINDYIVYEHGMQEIIFRTGDIDQCKNYIDNIIKEHK
jgi:hypothetical protein